MATTAPDEGGPPDATFTRQRWVPAHRREWAEHCKTIMIEHGCVVGRTVYDKRHQARWKARSLIRLMDELRILERGEMTEHTERKAGGWVWTVEYLPRGQAR